MLTACWLLAACLLTVSLNKTATKASWLALSRPIVGVKEPSAEVVALGFGMRHVGRHAWQ